MKKTLVSLAAVAAITLSAATAHAAFLPFTIDETQLGVGTYIVTDVGKLNGTYSEVITINPDFTFAATAFSTIGLLVDVDGAAISNFGTSKATDFNTTYGMYAVFNSTGVVSGPTTFAGLTGVFDLYIDDNGDTTPTFGATGDIGVTRSNTADDILLASSTNLTFAVGQGVGTDTTAFKFLFDDMTLSADGLMFFTSPNPFYMLVNVNGDFDDGLNATAPGTYTTTGDVSAQFEIPEPGTVALLGLALAGLGFTQRRRNAAK